MSQGDCASYSTTAVVAASADDKRTKLESASTTTEACASSDAFVSLVQRFAPGPRKVYLVVPVGSGQKAAMKVWSTLVDNEEYSDMVFVCKNDERVYAIRMVVCATCAAFKRLLIGGTKLLKNEIRDFPLPQISASVLRIVLEFLYTGQLRWSDKAEVNVAWDDPYEVRVLWSEALLTVQAAKFLALEELEKMVWRFLVLDVADRSKFQGYPDHFTCNAVRLSAIMEFASAIEVVGAFEVEDDMVCSNDRVIAEVMSLELVRVIKSTWLDSQAVHLQAFSEKALRFFLKNLNAESTSSAENSNDMAVTLHEYLHVRQIILWCACQSMKPADAQEFVKTYLPDAKSALLLSKNQQDHGVLVTEGGQWCRSQLKKACDSAGFVSNWLPFVNVSRIHPALLIKVLEPLDVIPYSQVVDALRIHALRRSCLVKVPAPSWEPGASFRLTSDQSVVEKLGCSEDVAIALVPILRNYGVYEWHITVENTLPESTIEVPHQPWEESWEIGILKTEKDIVKHENLCGASSTLADADVGTAYKYDIGAGACMWAVKICKGKLKRAFFNSAMGDREWENHPSGEKNFFCSSKIQIRFQLDMCSRLQLCSVSANGTAWTKGESVRNELELLTKPGLYYPTVAFTGLREAETGTRLNLNHVYLDKLRTLCVGRIRIELVSGFDIL